MKKKIALIGAGHIGGTLALLISLKKLGNSVLIDINEGAAKGKALDIQQAAACEGADVAVEGGSDFSLLKGADAVVVTAGIPRKPGMSREDLLAINARTITDVALHIKKYCPDAFVIVITNPLDAMVWVLQQKSGCFPTKVVGMAGVLDASRYRSFLAAALSVSVQDIQAMVMGGHGDTMVPLLRYTTVAGVPLSTLIQEGKVSSGTVKAIVERTRQGGGEIVAHLGTGSAFYAPAASAVAMLTSYFYDQKRIFPCAAWLSGQYEVHDMYVGVPACIGAGGVERVIELSLTEEEKEAFHNSVQSVRSLVEEVKKLAL